MRKIIVTAVLVGSVFAPTAAFADGAGYGSQPGFTVSNTNTPCAGHGAFGYFGPGNNMAGGANGYNTGMNNAGLCGNRQGNL
jgi:hypothetical protein